MTRVLSHDEARLLRLRAQRLNPRWLERAASVEQAVAESCGLQAQDAPAARLSVRARTVGLTAADVERARLTDRSVVRTWCMRGTLHLVAARDLGWLLPLLGPKFVAGRRGRYNELGLDEDTCVRAVRSIGDMLAHRGPLTRAEIVEQLAAEGIRAEGQAGAHLVGRAALEGLVCLGPDRGAKNTYVLLADWVDRGSSMDRADAQAELARRYLAAYGPAEPDDLAAWSGLSLGEARAAWKRITGELIDVTIAGRPAWMLATRAAWLDELLSGEPLVRLLSSFDTYVLGHRSRDLILDPQYTKRFKRGGGMLSPTLLVDGRVVGTWQVERHRDYQEIVVDPFNALAPQVQPGLEAEVADIARFLGIKTALNVMTH